MNPSLLWTLGYIYESNQKSLSSHVCAEVKSPLFKCLCVAMRSVVIILFSRDLIWSLN